MSNLKKLGLYTAMFALLSLVIVACTSTEVVTETVPVTVEVTRVEVTTIPGSSLEVTRIVTDTATRIVPVTPTTMPGDNPVTLNINWGTEPPTGDPALATDGTSVNVVGSLFMGLTRFDPVSGDVMPYLATEWSQGEDADGNQTWTFNLRNDIPWVNYNPVTGVTTQEVDADGNPRFVTAADVEYGVKRTINPDTGSDYAYVLYIIKNAQAVNGGEEGFSLDDVGVRALDETTIEFTLENPAGFFPAIAGMWIAFPQPQWAIEEWDQQWTEAGLVVSNGPYVLESWIHGGELNLLKNPLWPDAETVQIERIEGIMITEASTSFALYENNQLDTVGVPQTEIDRVKVDPVLSEELLIAPAACSYYYGFTNTKYPFTDARVRRAFSAAIDRQSLIDNVTKGGQIPATTFAPPGIFGAPEPGSLGLGFDSEFARTELQSFLDEEGLSIDDFNDLNITLMHNTAEGHARIAAAIQQMWKDTLGVEVSVENQEWAVYLDTLRNTTPIEEAPHIWRLGWCADYPDENNWVHEVFNSDAGANRLRRNCVDANCSETTTSEFDEITAAAGLAQDPAERLELYAQAEDLLAREEAAYAPIYHFTTVNVTKPWLQRDFPLLGPNNYFEWTIDTEAKEEAQ